MSSDLLAEFDSFYTASQKQKTNSTRPQISTTSSAFDDLSFLGGSSQTKTSPPSQLQWRTPTESNTQAYMSNDMWGGFSNPNISQSKPQAIQNDTDAWGEFETASNTSNEPVTQPAPPSSGGHWNNEHRPPDINMKTGLYRVSTDELFSTNIATLAESSAAQQRNKNMLNVPQSRSPLQNMFSLSPRSSEGGEVLFDADNEVGDEDDDFGDFETAEPSQKLPQPAQFDIQTQSSAPMQPNLSLEPVKAPQSAMMDLLDFQSPPPASKSPQKPAPISLAASSLDTNPYPYPQAPKSPSFQERNPFNDLALSTPAPDKKSEEPKRESPVTAWPVYEPKKSEPPPDIFSMGSPETNKPKNDFWDEFENLPSSKPSSSTPKSPSKPIIKTAATSPRAKVPIKAKATISPKATVSATSNPKHKAETPDLRPGLQGLNEILQMVDDTPPVYRDDEWAWDTIEPTLTTSQHTAPQQPKVSNLQSNSIPSSPPPTNIPPPSLLLSTMQSVLPLPKNSSLFTFSTSTSKSTSSLSPTARQTLYTSTRTHTFLQGYIALSTVAAHLLAGRKLRWKRDAFLAQSMSISSASLSSSGKSSGMKLTNIDKSEARREDREAAELLRIWREDVIGRLRGVVAGVNVAVMKTGGDNNKPIEHLVIPDIGENMLVKPAEGGLTDKKACFLCGLKREERVAGVDVDGTVEDSFGEWWVEHWGHRGCVNWWREWEGRLRGR